MVETGKLEEGVSLLKQAMAKHTENSSKAINAVYLAIAEDRLGNAAESQRYAALARQLDPKSKLLERLPTSLQLKS